MTVLTKQMLRNEVARRERELEEAKARPDSMANRAWVRVCRESLAQSRNKLYTLHGEGSQMALDT